MTHVTLATGDAWQERRVDVEAEARLERKEGGTTKEAAVPSVIQTTTPAVALVGPSFGCQHIV